MTDPTSAVMPDDGSMQVLELKMHVAAQKAAVRTLVALLRSRAQQTGLQVVLHDWATAVRSGAPTFSATVAPRLPELHPEAKRMLLAAWQEQTEAMLRELGL